MTIRVVRANPIIAKNMPRTPKKQQPEHCIRCIVFADVSGFGRLDGEQQMRLFAEHILRPISRLLHDPGSQHVTSTILGDCVCAIFESVRAGAKFALALRDLFRQDFISIGMSHNISIRCAMHLGEVCCFRGIFKNSSPCVLSDEITVVARVEPVVTPGEVWATEAAAADHDLRNDASIKIDSLGDTALAKSHGVEKLYRIRRAADDPVPRATLEQPGDLGNAIEMSQLFALYTDLVGRADPELREKLTEFYHLAIQMLRDR